MEPFDTFEHAGLLVELHYDTEPMSPREWSNVSVIASDDRDIGFADSTLSEDGYSGEIYCPKCDGSGYHVGAEGEDEDCERCEGSGMVEVSTIEAIKHNAGARVVIPARYADYGSGGASFYECDEDDANAYVFDTPESLSESFGDTEIDDDDLRRCLLTEIENVDQWLKGECYGYIIRNLDGSELTEDQLGPMSAGPNVMRWMDSCWGFLGELDYGKQEAKREAEHIAELLAGEKTEAAYWASRDVETVA